MEDLSITEKINLLQNTNVLLGSHSSGLINICFKPEEVVDIRDPNDNIKNAFFHGFELDLNYYMEKKLVTKSS